MKTTKVYKKVYVYGIPVIGDELLLSGRWKTVIKNDSYYLEFEDIDGNWWIDWNLIIITTEEHINECSNAGR